MLTSGTTQITLNILAQIIPGTLLPGNPLANMVCTSRKHQHRHVGWYIGQIFKAYSVQTLTEATSFVQDLKLGHYIKVPPRATFLGKCVLVALSLNDPHARSLSVSSIGCNGFSCLYPSWCQDLDFRQCGGYLWCESEESTNMSAQPSIFHRICRLVRYRR